MRTAKEREYHFRDEIKKLLEKHGAEMEITDNGDSYGMHLGIVEITMESIWDDNNELVEDFLRV